MGGPQVNGRTRCRCWPAAPCLQGRPCVAARAAAEEVKTASSNGAPLKPSTAGMDFDELTELIKCAACRRPCWNSDSFMCRQLKAAWMLCSDLCALLGTLGVLAGDGTAAGTRRGLALAPPHAAIR